MEDAIDAIALDMQPRTVGRRQKTKINLVRLTDLDGIERLEKQVDQHLYYLTTLASGGPMILRRCLLTRVARPLHCTHCIVPAALLSAGSGQPPTLAFHASTCTWLPHANRHTYTYRLIRIHAHKDAHSDAHTDAHSDAHMDTHAYAHTDAHTDSYTDEHTKRTQRCTHGHT